VIQKTLFGLLVAAALIAMPAANAGARTNTYTIVGGIGGVAAGSCTDCANAILGTTDSPVVNVGGALFTSTGSDWLSVEVADASGGPVSFSVGQNADPSQNLDTVTFDFCGTSANLAGLGLDAGLDLHVYVNLASPDCSNLATSGSITVTNADAQAA
jgi:hypothetical protein